MDIEQVDSDTTLNVRDRLAGQDSLGPAPSFPQNRMDEMKAHARDFAAAAWAARSGRLDGLDRFRDEVTLTINGRQDSGAETIYLARQLELIRQALYEVKYTPVKSPRLVSYNTSLPEGIVNYTVKGIDIAGSPEIGRDDTDQIPSLEMKVTSGTMSFLNYYLGYSVTDQDLAEAMFAGMPLDARKAMGVRTQFARKLDEIAFYGDKTKTGTAILGMLNPSGTTTYTVPTTGAGGTSAKFSDKAPDDVILDLNAAGDAIVTGTNETEEPDTWLLPLDAYVNIRTRRVGDGTSSTILQYFTQNRDGQVTVEKTTKSLGANNANWSGSGSQSRMLVYRNSPEVAEMMVPVPFKQKAPQFRGMRTTTFCSMRTGGVALYLPKAYCYADGVS